MKALQETGGDLEASKDYLRQRGLADAEKMAKTTAMHLEIPSKKVFVGSTGIISKLLPISIICQSIHQNQI